MEFQAARTEGGGPPAAVTGPVRPVLASRLLGGFEQRMGDQPLPTLESGRGESLLAYLLLHADAPQQRQRIAAALWPESSEAQARTNLRHVLHNLRRTLPEPDRYLDVTARTLQWRPQTSWSLDVAAFDDAVARAQRAADDAEAVAALREAVELYRGDLLPGCYDEWLDEERERLRGELRAALHRLAVLLEGRGDTTEAVQHAERLLRQDPLAEETYRLVMRLHDARGDRALALRAYHACAATLERELGTQPSAETRRQYERLLAAERVRTRTPGAAREAGPPLVGRAVERAELTRAWRAAVAGDAGLVLATGEAGIGKSRLLDEFRSWCRHHGARTVAAGAYPAEGTLAYGLVVSWLRDDALRQSLHRLSRAHLTELSRLLPELSARVPDLPRPQALPETELRVRLFDAVTQAILGSGGPVLLVADDVHWSDRESLRFVHYLLRAGRNARLLVAVGARMEELPERHALTELVAALRVSGRVTDLPLTRFDPAETATLARRLIGRDLDEAERARLHADTEGNPLFIVETLRAGSAEGAAERLSPRVQAVIESRLAQLSPAALDLLGVAATIGRDFTVDVLAEASGDAEEVLIDGLDELWRRRIIAEHGAKGYDFSHGKIRDVVYETLDPARRRRHHRRVAHALHRRHIADPGPVSGQLAVHFERSGAAEQAVDWYGRAAEAALRLYAHTEALRLLDHAIDLLATLPPSAHRDTRELALLTALAAPLAVVESFAAPRLGAIHERALRLLEVLRLEMPPPLMRSLAVASLTRGDFAEAMRRADELRVVGSHDADPVLVVEAAYVLGIAEFWQGHFPAARKHFEAAVARRRGADLDVHLIRYGLDPRVVCMSRLANTLWFLGRRGEAIRARDAALRWAEEVRHPQSRATALVFAGMLALDMRDTAGLRRYVSVLRGLGDEQYARATRLSTDALVGYLEVLDGDGPAGLARIRSVLDAVAQLDPAPGARASYRRILYAACGVAGEAEAGLDAVDSALNATDGVATWAAEAHRMRGEFLARLGAPADDVAAELDRALAVARDQGARLFELRCATAIVRLGSGDPTEARDRLAELMAGLDDAAGTSDWADAVELLGAERSAERFRNASSGTL